MESFGQVHSTLKTPGFSVIMAGMKGQVLPTTSFGRSFFLLFLPTKTAPAAGARPLC